MAVEEAVEGRKACSAAGDMADMVVEGMADMAEVDMEEAAADKAGEDMAGRSRSK